MSERREVSFAAATAVRVGYLSRRTGPSQIDEESLALLGHVPQGLGKCTAYKSRGCETCNFTGMKDRTAMFEIMPVTDEIRSLIVLRRSSEEIREVAQRQGMKTLRMEGLLKVVEGITTVPEVLRVTAE